MNVLKIRLTQDAQFSPRRSNSHTRHRFAGIAQTVKTETVWERAPVLLLLAQAAAAFAVGFAVLKLMGIL